MGFFEGCLALGATILLVGMVLLYPIMMLDDEGKDLTVKNYLWMYPKTAIYAIIMTIAVAVGFVLSPLIFFGIIGAAIYSYLYSDNWDINKWVFAGAIPFSFVMALFAIGLAGVKITEKPKIDTTIVQDIAPVISQVEETP